MHCITHRWMLKNVIINVSINRVDYRHPGGDAVGGANPLPAHRHMAASEQEGPRCGCPGREIDKRKKDSEKATNQH